MASASIRSPSTRPGPIDGSWAGSPTTTRWAPSGIALIRAAASSTSSMDASSTTTSPTSSGLKASWSKTLPLSSAAPARRAPSNRCTVVAGCPANSSRRFAARPVGAASATLTSTLRHSATIADTVRLLPVPGPPVSRLTPCAAACATAPVCTSSRSPAAARTARSPASALALAVSRLIPSAMSDSAWHNAVGATQGSPLPVGSSTPATSFALPAAASAVAAPAASIPNGRSSVGDHSDRRCGVPVPGEPGQGPADQRPAAADIVATHVRFQRPGQLVGLPDRGIRQHQQSPRIAP